VLDTKLVIDVVNHQFGSQEMLVLHGLQDADVLLLVVYQRRSEML